MILGVFLLHARDHGLRNVRAQPLRHLFVDDSVRGVSAHAAGVRARIAIADALVVLRGDQRSHTLAITQYQEGNLFSLKAFFQHHAAPASPSILPLSISARRGRFFFLLQITTPFPAAKPSAFTTSGVEKCASASWTSSMELQMA